MIPRGECFLSYSSYSKMRMIRTSKTRTRMDVIIDIMTPIESSALAIAWFVAAICPPCDGWLLPMKIFLIISKTV